MSEQSINGKSLTVSILSLSLLTVMAGAAVAPALGVIRAYFADSNQLFVRIKLLLGGRTKFLAPLSFLIGYLLLALMGGWAGTLLGSVFIGFANGAGIPYIMSEASMKAGKAAATTVMPLISAALYLAQFLSPVLMSLVTAAFGGAVSHLPYCFAIVLSVLFIICSALIPAGKTK